MKIAHLTANEKFTDLSARQFEEASPESNHYFIFCEDDISTRAQYAIENCHAQRIDSQYPTTKLLEELSQFDLIVFHSLYHKFARLALALPREQRLLWIFWGSEVYNDYAEADKANCGTQTARLWRYKPTQVIARRLKQWSDQLLTKIQATRSIKLSDKELVQIIQRMDYVGSFMDEDIQKIREYISFDAKAFWFSYSDLSQLTVGMQGKQLRGNGILFGNSATYSNNHLEVIQQLSHLDLSDHKIICPLSYGDIQYRDLILNQAQTLGSSFHPLTDFMSLEEYNQILLTCPVAIMGHYRQQAVTNIMALIWLGTRLYLSERNPVYHYLKRIGIELYSIEQDLQASNSHWNQALSQDSIQHNKQVIEQELAHTRVIQQLRSSLQEVDENIHERR